MKQPYWIGFVPIEKAIVSHVLSMVSVATRINKISLHVSSNTPNIFILKKKQLLSYDCWTSSNEEIITMFENE